MNTQACPYCSIELPDQALFCPMCAKQIRCKSCREMLWANARACISCGVLVGDSGDVPSDVSGTQPNAINRIVFKDHKRSLEANLTDESIRHMSGAVGQFISNRIFEEQPPRHMEEETYIRGNTDQSNAALPAPQPHSQIEQNIVDGDPHIETSLNEATSIANSDAEKLRRIFRYEGDQVKLIDSRLKAKSQRDFVKRLTCLFLYAHELEGRTQVPRSELNTILTKSAVYDGNSRKWIANATELLVDGDIVELSVPGRECAREFVNEVIDSNFPNTWSISSSSRSRKKKTNSETENTTD